MFSEPLAYPSALDQRPLVALPGGRRPTWRGFGARASCTWTNNRRLKLTLIPSVHFAAVHERSFSLRRGLNADLCLLQAEHHLWFVIGRSPRKPRRRPGGSPSTGSDAARDLARKRPSEGEEMVGRVPGVAVGPAQDRRGEGRFGDVRLDVESVQHVGESFLRR